MTRHAQQTCGATALVVAAVLVSPISAQQIKIDDLRAPASPAFVLLGVSPTKIERPTSPQALALNLLSATTEENLFPENYALEVAPFWLVPHPRLTYDEYYRPSFLDGVLQSLALSLGTAPLSDTAQIGTALALGIRTLLVAGRPHPDLAAREKSLRAVQDSMNRITLAADDEVDRIELSALPKEEQQRRIDSVRAAAQLTLEAHGETASRIALQMQELDKERVGWQAEFAAGLVLDYPGNAIDSARMGQAGVWLTVAHRMPSAHLDLVGVARYRHDRRAASTRNLLDYGGRLVWDRDSFAVSGEFLDYVGDETSGGEAAGYRLAINLEYQLGEWGALTATVANDDESIGGRHLVTSLGLNFGFGVLPLNIGGRR